MMKLRHLFSNLALAEMLVKNWDYDPDSLDLFQYFRISANAIYPFKVAGEVCFLRCCPAHEKSKAGILAELAFIRYLRGEGYPALEPLPSKSGETLVAKLTPWGEHFASVFKRVKGGPVEESSFGDEIIRAYGAALGQLHALSKAYQPQSKRWSHLEVLDWIDATLTGLGNEPLALEELRLLRESFACLPVTPGYYGLIHYDFELDNVYYDPATKTCSVIDFDDAMYHWYLMDVLIALVSLKEEIPTGEYASRKAIFLAGYRSLFELDERLWDAAPLFIRFASLFSYTRNARALQERWDHEPEWMVELRAKLTRYQVKHGVNFGQPVSNPIYNDAW
jgi:Ser/Thr protein kinase RdoA (MazF antagonist)